ncbi:anti-sigma factor domain-containing protein [Streptomyces sp. NPDC057939]|uniref:anti-sigma factor n=1 Tax=Streptomyces sp. NPDC057939 TaxID=3346284 RepID=UPI0036E743DD
MSTVPDPHASLGAYLLHAMPPDEEADFARHLAGCVSCRREAAALAPVVADLCAAPPVAPPPGARAKVLERIARTPQEAAGPAAAPGPAPSHAPGTPVGRAAPAATRPPGRVRRLRWALACCAAAAVAFGGIALWQHQEAEEARAGMSASRPSGPAKELAEVLAAPDAQVNAARFEDGATGCVIVSRSESRAAFIATGLPKLPADQVYALWYDDDGTTRSAGTLAGGGSWHIKLLDGPVDQATAVGVTVESAAGSTGPTTAPVGVVDIPA